eukprot:TRINITY_DN54950_c0_g1_i1.p1 TRINITY_DN54950_c0_g1~~TRINITY_DN54950_c0_g1_i1.p1  ORF type:complete len:486 (+),score=73.51 TRINITY_DN54950_c0_g1_i1:160-1617(+)
MTTTPDLRWASVSSVFFALHLVVALFRPTLATDGAAAGVAFAATDTARVDVEREDRWSTAAPAVMTAVESLDDALGRKVLHRESHRADVEDETEDKAAVSSLSGVDAGGGDDASRHHFGRLMRRDGPAPKYTSATLAGGIGAHVVEATRKVTPQRLRPPPPRGRAVSEASLSEVGTALAVPMQGHCGETQGRGWAECNAGIFKGKLQANVNGIMTAKDCAFAASRKCSKARFISFSPAGKDDTCAWYLTCDVNRLDKTNNLAGSYTTLNVREATGAKTYLNRSAGLAECMLCKLPYGSLLSDENAAFRGTMRASSFRENRRKYGARGELQRVSMLSNIHGAWCAEKRKPPHFIHYEFPEKMLIKEVWTMGNIATTGESLTSFTLLTSEDNSTWEPYTIVEEEPRKQQFTFDARKGQAPTVEKPLAKVRLDPAIATMHLRLQINAYQKFPCARVEVRGCKCTEQAIPTIFDVVPLPVANEPQWVPF